MTGNVFGWLDSNHQHTINPDAINCLSASKSSDKNLNNGQHGLISDSDTQYNDDAFSITYNGNPRWTSPSLQSIANNHGHAVAIKKAYEEYGRTFLAHLVGDFSLALVQPNKSYALLAIDRLGIQRLVYQSQHGLQFSNCLKTLRLLSKDPVSISQQAIFNYLYFHMVPSPGSIYEGISKLEPGHCVEYRNGKLEQYCYWQPDFQKSDEPKEQLHQHLHKTLSSAVTRNSSEEVGSFLSGGLDSSSVSGFLSKTQTPTKTFSIGFHAEGYDETEYARIASKHFGTEHHEYYVTPEDVLDIVPTIAESYDEPFGNSSAIPVYYCAKLAKENGCTTLLAGDGGDELFGGNERYVKQKIFEQYLKLPQGVQALNRGLFQGSLAKLPGIKKANSFLRQAAIPLPERMENYNFLHQNNPQEVFTPSFLSGIDTQSPLQNLQQRYAEPKQADYLDRMLYLDWKRTLADNDLRKVNEMCSLAGIRVQYPMLNDDLVALSCSIPSDQKIDGMKIRHFYKQAMKGFLPEQILNKSKHGFGLPFGVWMTTHPKLQEMAYGAIEQLKTKPYFRAEFLNNAIKMHQSGHASYYGELVWVLMMLSLWLEKHTN